MTERSLVEIGDDATLNEGSVIQPHSLEEGAFKSDFIRIGRGCTLGPAAFVHYGVVMGEGSIVDVDSFVMKGEVLEPYSVWRGNPAKLNRFVVPVDENGIVLADVTHAGKLHRSGTAALGAKKGIA